MRVNVSHCWAGGERFYFRLEFMWHGRLCRESVGGTTWNRKVASIALNILENAYGRERRSVRFIHH